MLMALFLSVTFILVALLVVEKDKKIFYREVLKSRNELALRGRYYLFVYPFYYPAGGMDDLAGQFNTVDEAIAFHPTYRRKDTSYMSSEFGIREECLAHIWDRLESRIVYVRERGGEWKEGDKLEWL